MFCLSAVSFSDDQSSISHFASVPFSKELPSVHIALFLMLMISYLLVLEGFVLAMHSLSLGLDS